ncbi:ribonuclease H-like domain-containing protein [Xylariaceae sp. FL1019]|nr:ribonuclease H-like domain-containing protein [Xylariaceae sp. FL1019]
MPLSSKRRRKDNAADGHSQMMHVDRYDEPTTGNKEARKHSHHMGGCPDGYCRRWPTAEYTDYGTPELELCRTDNLEIIGFYGFYHVRCPRAPSKPCRRGRYSLHVDSLVVAVDGACPSNGSGRAVMSSCGVSFNYDSAHNLAFRLPDTDGYAHTNQRAELSAALAGIEASVPFIVNGGQGDCSECFEPCRVRHLVIKSDSAYLVNGITQYIAKWQENGWKTATGTDVKNQELWRKLYILVSTLNIYKGVAIDFWHVPRALNKDADELANFALDRPLRPLPGSMLGDHWKVFISALQAGF